MHNANKHWIVYYRTLLPTSSSNPVTRPTQCRINNSSKCSDCYGPRAFGGPAVFCNKSYLLHCIRNCSVWEVNKSVFCYICRVSSKRRFSIERCLCPEILVFFFLYSYEQKALDCGQQWCHFSWFAAKPQDFLTVSCKIFNLAVS